MTYTLYASPGSCSLAPHIVLEDIGSPYHVMYVSTDKGETKTAEFREVNPKGRVLFWPKAVSFSQKHRPFSFILHKLRPVKVCYNWTEMIWFGLSNGSTGFLGRFTP